ncbi:MAG: N-acetylmuramoyl-L-alanine amidase [Oscillospiraceae bacterium]|nr:N-acetylmuramoyl-L-alanine amidase [Oscillospiraceae bacterium]
MFFVVKRHTLILFACAAVALTASLSLFASPALPAFAPSAEEPIVYVLDAGHGGEDGGALSAAGDKESDINLSITLRLDALLRLLGKNTVLTRDADVSVYTDGAETLRQKKSSDLRNRVALVNAIPGAILVSVHQNSLPGVPSVRGAQAFYNAVEPGDALARSVQSALNQSVNSGDKAEKQIDKTIYLMKNVTCPAILVECGFLSNADEAARLQTPEHQKKLVAAIAAGILNEREEP